MKIPNFFKTFFSSILIHPRTRGGRQKGSSPMVNFSIGSVATNPVGWWSQFDEAIKCVHPASEVGRDPTSLCLDLVSFT